MFRCTATPTHSRHWYPPSRGTTHTAQQEQQADSVVVSEPFQPSSDPPPLLLMLPPTPQRVTATKQEIELRPRTAITFTFRGASTAVGRLSESLYCESRVGKEKLTRQVFKVKRFLAGMLLPLLLLLLSHMNSCKTYRVRARTNKVLEPLLGKSKQKMKCKFVGEMLRFPT